MKTTSSFDSAPLISFFRDELLGESVGPPERVANVRRLRLVAAAVGPQSTRTELVQLLKECLDKFSDEDEFLFALAEELGDLCKFFGHGPDMGDPIDPHLHRVVPLLQQLATIEETVVREKAVDSLSKVIDQQSPGNRASFTQDFILPVFEKLAKAPWFTSRVSACGLFLVVYKYCNESLKPDIRKLFSGLCHDDTPMVRRAAASKFKEFFAQSESGEILTHYVLPSNTVFQYFWSDDTQDNIRCSVLEATVELARKLSTEDNYNHTVDRIKGAAQDRSWRVRLCLATQLDKLVECYETHIVDEYLLTCITDLLQDPEQEVRTAALVSLEKVMNLLTAEQVSSQIVPALRRISLDTAQPVRAALASTVSRAALVLGRESTENHLLPLIDQFMKDEYHDVRLNVVKSAGEICEVLGADAVAKSLLGTIQSLMSDTQWRIRLSVVNQIPQLARHFGPNLYSSVLEPMFMIALTDNVYAVRESAMQNARILTETFGGDWMTEVFLPKILENGTGSVDAFVAFQSKNSWSSERPSLSNGNGKPVSYLSRITVLQTLLHLASASVVNTSQVEGVILPLVLAAMKDHVPNVRFAAAKAATALATKSQISSASTDSQVKSCLSRLLQDEDLDVRYFAAKSLAALDAAPAAAR